MNGEVLGRECDEMKRNEMTTVKVRIAIIIVQMIYPIEITFLNVLV